MSWGGWFIVAAVIAAGALVFAGTVRGALAARDLATRMRTMAKLDIDVDRVRSSVERIQRDVTAMTALIERARAALTAIDANVRAMIRAFSRG